MDTNLVEIFYLVDEFCKEFDKVKKGHMACPRLGYLI